MSHKSAMFILYGIIVGVIAGVAAGWFMGEGALQFAWLGKLFLNALKMTILPLIVAAVITGIASLGDVRKLGRVGVGALTYYVITTGIAVFIGMVMVTMVEPGAGLTPPGEVVERIAAKKDTGITDIIMMLVPANLIKAAANLELLPLVFFSILFGAAMTTVGPVGEPVIKFFHGVNEIMMKLITWIMYLAPIGIFALVATRLGQAGGGEGFMAEVKAVGNYVMTVLSALAIHAVVLLFILFIFARRGFGFLSDMMRALLTALGTASSSATLPLTMECAREHGLSLRSVRFVLPLGSTVNMNGTALYEAVAAMFIAQAYGIDLSTGQQIIIFITATLAAVGAAGVPEAGLVTMIIVLNAVGLPLEGIGLLLAVDWFLDRFRTMINVWGDAVGAAVMHRHMPDEESDSGLKRSF